MARKNIFQLVEESYNIQAEISKINELFSEQNYFITRDDDYYYSLEELLEKLLFIEWKYRGTCISIDEYLERVNANIGHRKPTEEQIINNLEVMENFVKLYFDNGDDLFNRHKIQYYTEFKSVFCELINTLEKRMGLTKRECEDKVVLYPKNAPLEKVVDLVDDEDVQWELIRYVREKMSLSDKRKSLAYLATNLNIEEDKNEQNEHIKVLVKKAGNVLNNLHIRHNNKTGKWENKVLEDLDESDAISLCDMVYNEMLTIVLLREHKEYEKTYADFSKKMRRPKDVHQANKTDSAKIFNT